jgi:UDPglucose 6-dehydrogenase
METGEIRATRDTKVTGDITWSPDGTRIAFTALRTTENLYTVIVLLTSDFTPLDLYAAGAATDDFGSAKGIVRWTDNNRIQVNETCGVDCSRVVEINISGQGQQVLQTGRKQDGTSLKIALNQKGIAANPEFLRQGAALFDSFYPDRVVVGSENSHGIQRLSELFAPILEQNFPAPACLPRPEGLTKVPLLVCDLTSAEVIKYAANAFLALKISYINEIARLAQRVGADATLIARGIGLDSRIGPRFLNPGIGWGGSCFGKDTAALVATARDYQLEMPIVQAARDVNYRQRAWVVDALQEGLKILKGRHITLLGFSFKPDTDDLRDAPSLDIARLLVQRGAIVRAHDPVAMDEARRIFGERADLALCDTPADALQGADALAIVTEWKSFRAPDFEQMARLLKDRIVFDGRNLYDPALVRGMGFDYLAIGR